MLWDATSIGACAILRPIVTTHVRTHFGEFSETYFLSVSYTHLDVYKRQTKKFLDDLGLRSVTELPPLEMVNQLNQSLELADAQH